MVSFHDKILAQQFRPSHRIDSILLAVGIESSGGHFEGKSGPVPFLSFKTRFPEPGPRFGSKVTILGTSDAWTLLTSTIFWQICHKICGKFAKIVEVRRVQAVIGLYMANFGL